ncbi:hypothetical protein BKA70DRAFT_1238734 [Coprinopsis sp. MPI-PUGE-AT-0042]|nr:hypothetical protein BKA70DRAFT_1238734 [Coprinopsis sp. MPI-PUGE-AT-0042]
MHHDPNRCKTSNQPPWWPLVTYLPPSDADFGVHLAFSFRLSYFGPSQYLYTSLRRNGIVNPQSQHKGHDLCQWEGNLQLGRRWLKRHSSVLQAELRVCFEIYTPYGSKAYLGDTPFLSRKLSTVFYAPSPVQLPCHQTPHPTTQSPALIFEVIGGWGLVDNSSANICSEFRRLPPQHGYQDHQWLDQMMEGATSFTIPMKATNARRFPQNSSHSAPFTSTDGLTANLQTLCCQQQEKCATVVNIVEARPGRIRQSRPVSSSNLAFNVSNTNDHISIADTRGEGEGGLYSFVSNIPMLSALEEAISISDSTAFSTPLREKEDLFRLIPKP